ncbi:hypothetical protein C9374_007909 [Naegleria lovaniensis]|uniref:Uncharacterized protein n=1 Tax=Naegleria lovaniensis TaxID=51637 RepID=A0AA88KI11_NAELO|nr:uncharacterized protein C9374_007909 [Naegleria lovaniensis]KAG2378761.1 hypothetical protein C9374_007909 [Naegleria lovaniensis]
MFQKSSPIFSTSFKNLLSSHHPHVFSCRSIGLKKNHEMSREIKWFFSWMGSTQNMSFHTSERNPKSKSTTRNEGSVHKKVRATSEPMTTNSTTSATTTTAHQSTTPALQTSQIDSTLKSMIDQFMSSQPSTSEPFDPRYEIEIVRAQIKEGFTSRRGFDTILKYYHKMIDLLMDIKDLEQATTEIEYCIQISVDVLGENHINVFRMREKLALVYFYSQKYGEALKELHSMYFAAFNLAEANEEHFDLVRESVNALNYVTFFTDYFYGVFSQEELNTILKIYTSNTELSSKVTLISLAKQFPEWRRYEMADKFLIDKLKREENKLSSLSLMSYKADAKSEIRRQQDLIFEILKKQGFLYESEKRVQLAFHQYERTLTKAMTFYGKNSLQVGEVLVSLAAIGTLAEKFETSISYAKRACVLLNAIPDSINKKNPEYEAKLGKALITIGEIYSNGAKDLPASEIRPYLEAEKFISSGMNIIDKHYGRDNPTWILAAYSLASNYDLLCSCIHELALEKTITQMGEAGIRQDSANFQVILSEEDQKKVNDWREKSDNLFELIREVISMSPAKYLLKIPLTKGSLFLDEFMANDSRAFRQTTIANEYPQPEIIHELYSSSRQYHLVGSLEKGIEHLRNAIQLFDQQYGPEDYLFEREFASTELAKLYNITGNIDEALSLLEKSMARIEKVFGKESKLYLEVSDAFQQIASLKGLSEDQRQKHFQNILEKYNKDYEELAKQAEKEIVQEQGKAKQEKVPQGHSTDTTTENRSEMDLIKASSANPETSPSSKKESSSSLKKKPSKKKK